MDFSPRISIEPPPLAEVPNPAENPATVPRSISATLVTDCVVFSVEIRVIAPVRSFFLIVP